MVHYNSKFQRRKQVSVTWGTRVFCLAAYDVNTAATPDLAAAVLDCLNEISFWRLWPVMTVSFLSH